MKGHSPGFPALTAPRGRSDRYPATALYRIVQPVIVEAVPTSDTPCRLVDLRLWLKDSVHVASSPASVERQRHRCPADDEQVGTEPPLVQVLTEFAQQDKDLIAVQER